MIGVEVWSNVFTTRDYLSLSSVEKTQTESDLNQTPKSCRPDEFKLKLNSSTL